MSDLQTVEAGVVASFPPISSMHQPSGLRVMEVNPYLTCVLCGGYFIDATTITECLHSFCKTCIVRYLKSSKFCPICDVQVHKTRPLVNIRADKTLQDIVYKLVPGLFRNEMKRRREFYSAHPKEAAHVTCQEDRGDLTEQRVIYSPDDIISLSLEYGYGNNQLPTTFHCEDKTDSRRRFLQCPAAVTVLHLKKFVTMKYNLSQTYLVSIMYYDEVLQDKYKLMDIAYIYTWKRNEPMRLFYRITDNHKKIPSTSSSTCFQTSAGVGVSETMTRSRPLLSGETLEINTGRTDTSSAQKREKRRKPPVETRLSLKKKKRTFKNKKKRNNLIDLFHKPSEGRSPSVTGLLEDDDRNVRTSKSDSQKKSSKQSFPEAPLKFPVKNGNDPEKEFSKNKMAKRSHVVMETFSKPEKKTVLKQKVAFQKSKKRVGPVLPQKAASDIEINNNTNAVESKKLCSSFGNNKVSFSESTNTEQFVERGKPTIPFRSRKPANTADSKRNTSQVSSVKNTKVAEIKHISNSSDTKNPSCQAETKKVSTITESKKLVYQNETKTRKNSSESSARVTSVENKQFVNRTAPTRTVKPDEAMKPSILIEVNSVSTTPDSKKLVNEKKTLAHVNPSEANNTTLVDSVERVNRVSRTETTEHINPDETREHDGQTNIRELCNQTQTRELVASPEVRTLDLGGTSKPNSEFPTIRTSSVRTAFTYSAPSLSSEFIASGTQDTDPTLEMLATSAGKVDRKVAQNPLILLSGENTGVSRQLAIIEKKSRRESELKVTKSPEFFVSKPGEIPPLKISRKLSIQVADRDKLDYKTCSGLSPETQLNSGGKLSGLGPETKLSSEAKVTRLGPETKLSSEAKVTGLGPETKLNSEDKVTRLGPETKLSSEAKVTGLGPETKLNSEDKVTELGPETKLSSEAKVTRLSPENKLNSEDKVTELGPETKLSSEAKVTRLSPETKLNSEDKVRGLNSDIQLNSEDKLSGLSPETQLNNWDKFRAPVFSKTTPKRQKSPFSTPCFTTTVKQPSTNGVLHLSPTMGYPSCPTPLRVPSALPKSYPSPRENFELPRDDIGALDLSLTHRQEVVHHNQSNKSSSRHAANPPVLEKLCRPPLCLSGPAKLPLTMSPPPVPHGHTYSRKVDSGRNHRYKSGTLTVITSDPNSYRPKIVIKNLDPRPDHGRHQYSHRT